MALPLIEAGRWEEVCVCVYGEEGFLLSVVPFLLCAAKEESSLGNSMASLGRRCAVLCLCALANTCLCQPGYSLADERCFATEERREPGTPVSSAFHPVPSFFGSLSLPSFLTHTVKGFHRYTHSCMISLFQEQKDIGQSHAPVFKGDRHIPTRQCIFVLTERFLPKDVVFG